MEGAQALGGVVVQAGEYVGGALVKAGETVAGLTHYAIPIIAAGVCLATPDGCEAAATGALVLDRAGNDRGDLKPGET